MEIYKFMALLGLFFYNLYHKPEPNEIQPRPSHSCIEKIGRKLLSDPSILKLFEFIRKQQNGEIDCEEISNQIIIHGPTTSPTPAMNATSKPIPILFYLFEEVFKQKFGDIHSGKNTNERLILGPATSPITRKRLNGETTRDLKMSSTTTPAPNEFNIFVDYLTQSFSGIFGAKSRNESTTPGPVTNTTSRNAPNNETTLTQTMSSTVRPNPNIFNISEDYLTQKFKDMLGVKKTNETTLSQTMNITGTSNSIIYPLFEIFTKQKLAIQTPIEATSPTTTISSTTPRSTTTAGSTTTSRTTTKPTTKTTKKPITTRKSTTTTRSYKASTDCSCSSSDSSDENSRGKIYSSSEEESYNSSEDSSSGSTYSSSDNESNESEYYFRW